MWPLFVVFGEPSVQIGLQFLDRAVQFLLERDIVELIFDGPMGPFADAVCLGLFDLVFEWSISSTAK